MISNDAKLQTLHDHYKDSFSILQAHLQRRDFFFFLVLLTAALVLFQVFSPDLYGTILSQVLSKKLELKEGTSIDLSFIGSMLWFALLALVVRYFQTAVLIERQYKYIHMLEAKLTEQYDGVIFTRESKSYLNNYPKFSDLVYWLYTLIFPALLLTLVAIKTVREIKSASLSSFLLWFDVVIAVLISVLTALYLLMVHRGK